MIKKFLQILVTTIMSRRMRSILYLRPPQLGFKKHKMSTSSWEQSVLSLFTRVEFVLDVPQRHVFWELLHFYKIFHRIRNNSCVPRAFSGDLYIDPSWWNPSYILNTSNCNVLKMHTPSKYFWKQYNCSCLISMYTNYC